MTSDIPVSHLSKHYQAHQKEPGFTGSLRSFFRRQYQTVRAVDDVTFTIKPGEIVGFLGPNGAGKTTTLKVLSGLLYPTSEEVNVCGFRSFERKDEFLRQITLVMRIGGSATPSAASAVFGRADDRSGCHDAGTGPGISFRIQPSIWRDVYRGPLRFILTFIVPIAFLTTFPAATLLGQLSRIYIIGAVIMATTLFYVSAKFWRYAIRFYSSASS